ncbi:hypothetical protein GLR48_01470 [Loktanella sp. M215]|nr:hypothetical protein [Loktanella sp. M215]
MLIVSVTNCPARCTVLTDILETGHDVSTTKVLISGTRRGLTPKLKTLLRRRGLLPGSSLDLM